MSTSFDVVVVGAGINGACTAFELASRGLKVALVERLHVGEGPSGRSSAIIRTHYSNELTAAMALYSLRIFQRFAEVYDGGECGFQNVGFAVLVSRKDVDGLRANLAMHRRVGIRAELIAVDDLAALLPGAYTDDLEAVGYEPESGYCDPYLTVNSVVQAARRRGVQLFQVTTATAVAMQGGRAAGVVTDQGELAAGAVVIAGGPWAPGLARSVGVELPLNPCRVQVAFFRPPAGYAAPFPVVADFINATYFRPETGGLTLVGLVDPVEANYVVDPDRYNEHLDRDFVLDAGERLVRRRPIMEQGESAGGYAALYDITPDWHPVIDEAPAGSGVFLCAGFSGHGFKLGPAVGRMVADMVTQAKEPLFDPRLFRLSRFAEGDPVRGRYEYSIAG